MKIIRWIAFIPGAAITGVLISILAGIPLALAHGWKFLSELLNAPDMAGSYIVGTYCLVLVRGALGAGSTWAAYQIAPSVKLRAAYVWFILLALTLCLFLLYLNLAMSRAHLQLTFSAGWRAIVEAAGLLGGSLLTIRILREQGGIVTPAAGYNDGEGRREAVRSDGNVYMQKLKGLGIAVLVGLILFFWARADYKWAPKTIKEKKEEGWVLAATVDNFVSPSRPWSIFKAPVTGLWFVQPKECVRLARNVYIVPHLRVRYDYDKVEEETGLAAYDSLNHHSAYVPKNSSLSSITTSALDWRTYEPQTPGRQLQSFVETTVAPNCPVGVPGTGRPTRLLPADQKAPLPGR